MTQEVYEIESAQLKIDPACSCCGDRPVRLTKFIQKRDKAWAVFYGTYSNQHPELGLRVLLSLGPWWEGTRPEGRSCFHFQVSAEPEGDVSRSPM